MDISKIRKKMQEKEQQPEQQPTTPLHAPPKEDPETPLPETLEESEPAPEDAPGSATEQGNLETQVTAPPASIVKPEEEKDEEEILEFLTFSLSKEEFAFRVSEVEEIIRAQTVTKVPTMPSYVLGITSLRGKIIPVLDLKARLIHREGKGEGAMGHDTGERQVDRTEKILILSGPQGMIGATIDKVMSVVRFPKEELLDPPAHLSEEERRLIEGVVILDRRFISVVRGEEALQVEIV